jgi:hypothetical protein
MSADSNSGTAPQLQAEPRILRIFISYASEDLLIATALAKFAFLLINSEEFPWPPARS